MHHTSREEEETSVDEASLVPSRSKGATSRGETMLVSSSSKREPYNTKSTHETTLMPYITAERAIHDAALGPYRTSRKEETHLSERALVPSTTAVGVALPPPEDGNFRHRKKKMCSCCRNKVCCRITIVTVVLLVALLLFLKFYIFKARKPEITSTEVKVKNLTFSIEPVTITLVLAINVEYKNPNFAGWKYKDSNTTLYYHGPDVGLAKVPAGVVNSRSSAVVNVTIDVNTTAMTSSKYLVSDLKSGYLPLNTYTLMTGKVMIIKIVKIRATVQSYCSVNITLATWNTTTACQVKVHL